VGEGDGALARTGEPQRAFRIQVVNRISTVGLSRFPADGYVIGVEPADADAILVRSAVLDASSIPAGVLAIARAGAGTNNIPVQAMSARGVPVFNAPGANANAVKELVVAGLLMAARNLPGALQFVTRLDPSDAHLDATVEEGKKAFAGFEVSGQTLGIIGLGMIGCLVADAALKLGMKVAGYDPDITVDAAWSLPSQVRKTQSVVEILKSCDFVTLHVPLVEATRGLVNADNLRVMRGDAVLLNFSREGVVDEAAVLAAIAAGKLRNYVCDFPSAALSGERVNGVAGAGGVIVLPHLGASTREAEDNCAAMVVDQLRDYLEHGNIRNAVNFPAASAPRESDFRIAIANANVPNMLGQISTAMANAGLNIHTMLNRSRGDMAYTLVDVDSAVDNTVIGAIRAIDGVLSVRYLPMRAGDPSPLRPST
jgi:D-3-phosphoglycerate dehydrogenase / 2-oxoglutarate reductase